MFQLVSDVVIWKLLQEKYCFFLLGDLECVGKCVGRYWEMKKRMAPGCESMTIATIMTVLKPYMYGMCSAGAGGGGFIYGIMKEPRCHEFIKEILYRQEVSALAILSFTFGSTFS